MLKYLVQSLNHWLALTLNKQHWTKFDESNEARVIPTLLFGLGVEMDHIVGSKILIIVLAKLVFSITYDEVKQFK